MGRKISHPMIKSVSSADHRTVEMRPSINWETATVEQMENTARNEESRDCSRKINGKWLEVQFNGNGAPYSYKYGATPIDRQAAVQLLALV